MDDDGIDGLALEGGQGASRRGRASSGGDDDG